MPVDFTDPEAATTRLTDSKTEGSMFAPTPLWDRAPKSRRRGARSTASRPRHDPAIDAGEPGAGAGAIGATTAAEPLDIAYETQRADAEPRIRRKGAGTGAIAAGVVVVAALGGVGWYASQQHAQRLVELTPGTPATSEVALNTAAPPATPAPAAGAPATDSATTTQDSTTTTTRPATSAAPQHAARSVAARAPAPRVRPSSNASALSSGMDASATAPVINTPAPSPSASPMQTPPVNPIAPAPAPAAPSTTSPAAGSVNDSSAPTASAPADPTVTP